MNSLDVEKWVNEESDRDRKEFRSAVHLIIRAIATSKSLSPFMIMKGGILLAIRYHSPRFTKDVDFSTPSRLQEVNIEELLANIKEALEIVGADNDYGIAVSLQSHKINPPNRPEVSFPTLQLKIGFASRSDARQLQRLTAKQSPKIVQIDYSFNEWISEVETNEVDGGALKMYPYHDLIAEKIRSVLQQPIRERARFQDIYDLYLLLTSSTPTVDDCIIILEKIYAASKERKVPIFKEAMQQSEVIEYSKREYGTIAPLIGERPPSFDLAYQTVQDFFENLPWK